MPKKNNTKFLMIILIGLLLFFYAFPYLLFKIGENAYVNKNYVRAFNTLSVAYHMHKQNEDYRYYYARTLTNLKPVLQVQKDLFEISQSKIDDGAKRVAAKKLDEWRLNVNYNIGNNYIYNAPSEKGIVRWDDNKFPLKVAIDETVSVPSYYRNEIVASLNQWSRSVDFLKFKLVNKTSDADIVLKIAALPKNACKGKECKFIVGFTVPTIKNRILKKMTITLYDKTPTGEYFSDKELFNTVMHELGHAFGIMGHSYYEGDLMFVSTTSNNEMDYARARSSFQFLTSSDINTIKLLYKLIPDVSNTPVREMNTAGLIYAPIIIGSEQEMQERKVQEALAYINEAPDMSGGYVDLAIAYSELGHDDKALQAFKKAMKFARTDAEKYIVYYNLAVQLASMNKKSKALKYAQKAKNINPTDEVIELISKISR